MPTKIGSTSSASTGGAGAASLTFSATVAAGTNRALVVGLSFATSGSPPVHSRSVTWNGTALTLAGQYFGPSGGDGVELWYLLESSLSNVTANVVVTAVTVNQFLRAGAQLWGGVKQSAPFGTLSGQRFGQTSATFVETAFASAPDDQVTDVVHFYSDNANTLTAVSTGLWKVDNGLYEINAGQSHGSASAGTTTALRWNFSVGATDVNATVIHGGAALQAAPVITWLGPDLTTAGWISTAGTLWEAIDETTADSADRITSPALSGTVQPYKATLAVSKAAGSYTFSIRAYLLEGTGKVRVRFYSAADVDVGVTADQTLTLTETTYAMSVTLSGTATKIQIETVSL